MEQLPRLYLTRDEFTDQAMAQLQTAGVWSPQQA